MVPFSRNIWCDIVVVIFVFPGVTEVVGGKASLFSQVSVWKDLLDGDDLTYETKDYSSSSFSPSSTISVMHRCSLACSLNDWCDIWCLDQNTCFISSLVVSPEYREVKTSDIFSCYTRRLRNMAVDIPITGSYRDGWTPLRVPGNLVTGIYDYFKDSCYKSGYVVDPWLLLDLGELKVINEVLLMFFQTSDQRDIDIRVGNQSATNSEFATTYQLFGRFQQTVQKVSVARAQTPFVARYVSVQGSTGLSFRMFICHIEIR